MCTPFPEIRDNELISIEVCNYLTNSSSNDLRFTNIFASIVHSKSSISKKFAALSTSLVLFPVFGK